MNSKLRWDLIYQIQEESQLVTPGNDRNEQYEGQLKYIQRNKQLTKAEKEEAKDEIIFAKDVRNLIELKGPTYACERCYGQSLTISSCEHCVRNILRSEFNNWTWEMCRLIKPFNNVNSKVLYQNVLSNGFHTET